MPRTKAPITPPKPYIISSSPSSPNIPNDQPKKKRAAGKAWTSDEILLLFNTALKHGASIKAFDGLVEGRTGKQCYDTFNNTIVPRIRRSLAGDTKA